MVRSRTALAVFGCAAALVPAVAGADVRIEERGTSLETKITRWTAIKGSRRAVVTRTESAGVLYNAGAKYGASVEIHRPDRDVIWDIDPQDRTYREVKAEEFSRVLQRGVLPPANPNAQPLRTLYRSETTAIEVVPTGKRKQIAGYPVEEVAARVVVGAVNQLTGNRLSFTFDQLVWICKEPRLVKEIQECEEAYLETFGSVVTLQQAQVMGGEWSDAFINHLRAVNDRVRALGGYPLATTTIVTEQALAKEKGGKNTTRHFTVAAMEVRKVSLESIPDREFELPPGYLNRDTKVAAAPSAPAAPAPASPTPARPTPEVAPSSPPVVAAAPKPGAPAPGSESPASPKPSVTASPAASPVTARTDPKGLPGPAAVPGEGTDSGMGSRPPVTPGTPAPKPVVPKLPVQPTVPIVTAPPTNVIVPGTTAVVPAPTRGAQAGKKGEPAPAAAIPTVTYTKTAAPPPPVTVDEPKDAKKKKKRRFPF